MVRKKVQLHASSGKCKNLPKPTTPIVEPTPSTSSTVLDGNPNSELAQKFELELCWCIQQLQTALKNGKLNPKQVEEQRKVLNTLMSSTAPVVKKRQVMRMTFGDYRAKMEAEEKKYRSQSNVNRVKLTPVEPSKSSVFIKKSLFSQSGKEFKFNFDTPTEAQDVPDVSSITISDSDGEVQKEDHSNGNSNVEFSYVRSMNEFKFNFELSETDVLK